MVWISYLIETERSYFRCWEIRSTTINTSSKVTLQSDIKNWDEQYFPISNIIKEGPSLLKEVIAAKRKVRWDVSEYNFTLSKSLREIK